ncbi:MAG: hypothetical protein JXB47_14820 [Anaerolineae bacterium]|nr:hypothetical protein [Anaerolineae bacterium]
MSIQCTKLNAHSQLVIAVFVVLFLVGSVQPRPAYAAACGGLPTYGTVAAGTYNFPPGCVHTLTDQLVIFGGVTVTINGNGGTIEGDNTFRLFQVTNSSTLNLDSVTLTKGHTNLGGGAVGVIFGSSANITNSTFYGNSADSPGGALVADGPGGALNITNSTFFDNTAVEGGAIGVYYGITANIDGSAFSNNRVTDVGGAIYSSSLNLNIRNSTFVGNTAEDEGGAIFNVNSTNPVSISGSAFSGNSASFGGAIYAARATLTVDGCSVIQGNTARSGSGAGIFNGSDGIVTVSNSSIQDEVYHEIGMWGAASTTAEDNWWGSPAGPGALAVNFTVNSWWTQNYCAGVSGDAGPLPRCKTRVPFVANAAPADGELRFYTHFGYDYLRPEGYMVGAFPVMKDQVARGTVEVFCEAQLRAWLFDFHGIVQSFIPSQYYDHPGAFVPHKDDYGVGGPMYGYWEKDNVPYAAFFDRRLPPDPIDADNPADAYDPGVPDFGEHLVRTPAGEGGLVEWGSWDPQNGVYTRLGWTGAGGKVAADPDGPLDQKAFEKLVMAHGQ